MNGSALASVFALFLWMCVSHAQERPNIVFVFVDDLGFHDVGYHGSEIMVSSSLHKRKGFSVHLGHPTFHRAQRELLPNDSAPASEGQTLGCLSREIQSALSQLK